MPRRYSPSGMDKILRAGMRIAEHRFIRFLIAGGSGALLNIGITFVLTHFVFGMERYFTAFLIGTAVNVLYNFTLYTLAIFKTKEKHLRRFVVFAVYSVLMTVVQLSLVNYIARLTGPEWYLIVIASVIFVGALFNYVVFKTSIFKTITVDVPAR